MAKFDLAEGATHLSNQSLVTAALDGVVSEKADAVYTVGEDVIVLPEGRVGRREVNPLQGVKESADLGRVVSRTQQCSDPVGVSGIDDDRTPGINWSGLPWLDMDSPASRGECRGGRTIGEN